VGLALAIGFTGLANLLAATLVWDQWLPGRAREIALAVMAGIWVIAWVDARADWRRILAEWSDPAGATGDPQVRIDQAFRDAQAAYLAGDWVSAEKTLLELLRLDGRDAEARLLVATIWRHEQRLDAASSELDRLERLETAAPWQFEIARERERICAARVESVEKQQAPEFNGDSGANEVRHNDSNPLRRARAGRAEVVTTAAKGDTDVAATNRRMAA
jgi:hypothetical protein